MDGLYPPGPKAVPPDLTRPTRRFRLHAWLAVLVLLGFVALYFFLTYWLGWTAYRLVRDGITSGNAILGAVKALPAAFLFAFLFRGLFAVKHAQSKAAIEITAAEEPKLFEFLARVADEAGAPRAHRVFLSPDVNAGVFYDLSLLNLILPSKKNLEVGLGLLNTLTLGETKAVIAHEFGHFAQKSMAVGRWVYIAEQIAGHIIASRTIFDRILWGISSIDLRIAWIGWIMQLLVWSIRAVLDTAFRFVVLAKRALSREMELQADLVAVSLTGSDALVHALHKLHAADEAWASALSFGQGEVQKGRTPEDLFAIHTRMIESLRRITGKDTFGVAPALPESGREAHRVFPDRFAQPPRMWSTHPPNREREDNAKRTYVVAPIDDRPSWLLLADASATRRRMTTHLLELINPNGLPEQRLSTEGSVDEVDASFSRTYLHTRYRGLYLGRRITLTAPTADALYDAGDDPSAIDDLYPEEIVHELEAFGDLSDEHATLQALKDGFLTAPGRLVRYRGKEIQRKHLGPLIDEVKRERDEALAKVTARDRRCRSVHLAAAAKLGESWREHYTALLALLHYAEHTEADLRDADGHLQNVFAVVIADGRVSNAERKRLVNAADEAYQALGRAYGFRREVELPEAVARRMEIASWADRLGELQLNRPDHTNIGDWLQVADSWLVSVANDFGELSAVTLEVLLDAEDHIARCVRGECDAGEAPAPARVPSTYTTLLPGQERERQKKLDLWDRFQLAEGFFPGLARFSVAGAVLGGAFLLGAVAVEHTLTVHNGLDTEVRVEVEDEVVVVAPRSDTEVDIPDVESLHIRTTTAGGELVEDFRAELGLGEGQAIYNVAGAAPLIEWTASYGYAGEVPPRMLGAPRVTRTSADVLFRQPPESVSTRSGTATMRVLESVAGYPPVEQLGALTRSEDQAAVIFAHARFDDARSSTLDTWLSLAVARPGGQEILARRLAERPDDVVLLKLEQDAAGDGREEVCSRQRATLGPRDTGDAAYLLARCVTERDARTQAFLDAYERHPGNPFVARAAGMTLIASGDWDRGIAALDVARGTRADQNGEVSVDLARAVRARASDTTIADLGTLVASSSEVQRLRDVEIGADWVLESSARAYHLLGRGQLDEAVQVGGDDRALLRLAAASDGASPDLVDRVRALFPGDGIDPYTVWPTIALALRSGDDPTPYIEAARRMMRPEQVDQMLDWASPTKLRDDRAALEADLRHLVPSLRGHARVMGIIVLGDEAPDAWRREANALLFASERPYLTDASSLSVGVRLAPEDGEGAVDLLGENQAREAVRERHRGQ